MHSSRPLPAPTLLGKNLTRRANQRHSFIIAQSVKRPWARNGAPFRPEHRRWRSNPGGRTCAVASLIRFLHIKSLPISIGRGAPVWNMLSTPTHADVFDAKRQAVNCNERRIKCTVTVIQRARPAMRMTIGRHCKRRPTVRLTDLGISVSLPNFIQ